jgi:hypothetical protein
MMYKKALTITVVLVLLGAITLGYAFVPQTINYQGRLEDSGGSPVNGLVSMTFGIYNVPSGGSPLWSETRDVTVTDGAFSVRLGIVNTIDITFDEQYYLGVKIGAEPEMAPRQAFATAPYAFRPTPPSARQSSRTSASPMNCWCRAQ